jgi:hypothetical protein
MKSTSGGGGRTDAARWRVGFRVVPPAGAGPGYHLIQSGPGARPSGLVWVPRVFLFLPAARARPSLWYHDLSDSVRQMTQLKSPGTSPEVRRTEDGIAVLLRPTNVSQPIEEWIKIFNDLAANTAYGARKENEDLVLVVSFTGNEDQASTEAMLDAVVDLMSATDAQFEEVRTAEQALHRHVENWWISRTSEDLQI